MDNGSSGANHAAPWFGGIGATQGCAGLGMELQERHWTVEAIQELGVLLCLLDPIRGRHFTDPA